MQQREEKEMDREREGGERGKEILCFSYVIASVRLGRVDWMIEEQSHAHTHTHIYMDC